jgi:hypothetical protein
MEPLHPEARAALKKAHPGLTDPDIDYYESLVSARFNVDPSAHPERLAEIDRQRLEFLKRSMPHFEAVVRQVAAERKTPIRKPQARIDIDTGKSPKPR